ncbi:MAG: hypothetical protein V3U82_01560 [Robiginitomaculum sp.]
MLGKALLATLLGGLVTGGAVYVSQHPETLDPLRRENVTSPQSQIDAERRDRDVDVEAPQTDMRSSTDSSANSSSGIISKIMRSGERESATPEELAPETVDLRGNDYEAPKTSTPVVDPKVVSDIVSFSPISSGGVLDRVMSEAAKIRSGDLRDQAYLDIVEYALEHKDFGAAMLALETLDQPQIRDTARSKMAVKYAQLGQRDDAFALIEEVEIEELRDFMRLQVIEALILPPAQHKH